MRNAHYLYDDALTAHVRKVNCFEAEVSTTGIPFVMYDFHCCWILMLGHKAMTDVICVSF